MKKSVIATLAIILGVALCWAAPPVDQLPSLLPTPAEARITSVIVGGSPPAAAPSYTYVYSGGTATPTGSASQEGNYCIGALGINDTSSRTAKVLGMYIQALNGATECKIAIYNATTTNIITSCTVSSPAAGQWNDCSISDTTIPDTPSYMGLFMCNDGDVTVGIDSASAGRYIALEYASFPPATNTGSSDYSTYMFRFGY